MAETYAGRCFCGAIAFEAEGEPAMQGWCHCADCRAWSGTPVTQYALWPAGKVRFTEGAEHLRRFDRQGRAVRLSCARCGGAVGAELPAIGMVDIYAPLLPGFEFRPTAHAQMAESVMDIADDLPKFDRWPT